MIVLSGYDQLQKIYQSKRTLVMRGVREVDGLRVAIKVADPEHSTPLRLAQLRYDFEIRQSIQAEGILRVFGLERAQQNYALIQEDAGGPSLEVLLREKGGPLEVARFLPLAISLVRAVGKMHEAGVTHRALHAGNVVCNRSRTALMLIDFGRASRLAREFPQAAPAHLVDGNLSVLAPEQSGLTAHPHDFRGDYYAIGVLFFQMLTGQLPYDASDPQTVVDLHRVGPLPSMRDVRFDVPEILDTIVQRLMQKHPGDRYQSIQGLLFDLEHCERQWNAQSVIGDFAIGSRDSIHQLILPDRLYGRREVVLDLERALERTGKESGGLVVLSSEAGAGTSRIIGELGVLAPQSHIARGRFDRLSTEEGGMGLRPPVGAIFEALDSLLARQLTGEEDREEWKEHMLEALGRNARALADWMPHLDQLIGGEATGEDPPPRHAALRLEMMLLSFLKVFASQEKPLLLVLENLHLADEASTGIVGQLLAARLPHLLILVTVSEPKLKGDDDPDTERIQPVLDGWRDSGVSFDRLQIKAWDKETTNAYLARVLHSNPRATENLSNLLHEKTGGNAFHLERILQSLHRAGIIRFEGSAWKWDLDRINVFGLTRSVAALIERDLRQCNETTQELARLAALLGARFDLAALVEASGLPLPDCVIAIRHLLDLEIIAAIDGNYRYLDVDDEARVEELLGDVSVAYEFRHEFAREAAMALIDESERVAMHVEIGRAILRVDREAENDSRIFDIVDHMLAGLELITMAEEKTELARLGYTAALRLYRGTAYLKCLQLARRSMELLASNSWEGEYNLTRGLHRLRFLCELVAGDAQAAQRFFDKTLKHTRQLPERALLYDLRIQQLTSEGNTEAALATTREALRAVGLRLPAILTMQTAIFREIVKGKLALRSYSSPLEFAEARDLADPDRLAGMRIVSAAIYAGMAASPELLMIAGLTGANLSLKHGASVYAAPCFGIAALVTHSLRDFEAGREYGELMLRLAERYGYPRLRGLSFYIYAANVLPFHERLHGHRELESRFIEQALMAGDLQLVVRGRLLFATHRFFAGEPLKELQKDLEQLAPTVARSRHDALIRLHELFAAIVAGLLGTGPVPEVLPEEVPGELKRAGHPNAMATGISLVATHLYLARQFDRVAQVIRERDEAVEAATVSRYDDVVHTVFAVLAQADAVADDRSLSPREMQQEARRLELLADHLPENYLALRELVTAAIAEAEEDVQGAILHYRDAREAARKYGMNLFDAIISERGGRFYNDQRFTDNARTYLSDAVRAYYRWGAVARAEQLRAEFPELVVDEAGRDEASTPTHGEAHITSLRAGEDGASADLESVMELVRSISRELDPERLVRRLLLIIIQQTRAQKAILIQPEGKRLIIRADANVDRSEIRTGLSVPLAHSDDLAEEIVQYISRGGAPVVLAEAAYEGPFREEPYIVKYKPRSLMCVGLRVEKKLVGVLYLENNLASGVFAPDRAQLAREIASQAAIALENAKHFEELTRSANTSRSELEQERSQSRALLSGIIPASLVERYREQGTVPTSLFRLATVAAFRLPVYEDLASRWEPAKLAAVMSERYARFDRICQMHNVEPIRVAPNQYVCAAGVPDPRRTHTADACQTALVARHFVRGLGEARVDPFSKSKWDFSAALHTASLTAGLIGTERLRYDVWGPANTVATILLSRAEPDEILVTEETMRDVSQFFDFDKRDLFQDESGKEYRLYSLRRIKYGLARDADGVIPNEDYENLYDKLRRRP